MFPRLNLRTFVRYVYVSSVWQAENVQLDGMGVYVL